MPLWAYDLHGIMASKWIKVGYEMKGKLLYFISGFAAAVVLTTALPTMAASIEATFNTLTIKFNGTTVAEKNKDLTLTNGSTVPFSIVYNGTTYLPLRNTAEILGLEVAYDGVKGEVDLQSKNTEAQSIVKTENLTSDGLPIYSSDEEKYILVLDFNSKYTKLLPVYRMVLSSSFSSDQSSHFYLTTKETAVADPSSHSEVLIADLEYLNLSESTDYNNWYISLEYYESTILPLLK